MAQPNPLVSIIIPVYNVEQYLERCVASVRCQTYRNLEILLIDDGSTDRCGAMCDAYAQEDGRIRALHKKNGGQSDARNVGIEASTGDYVAFIDSDDFIEPDMIETLLRLIERYHADFSSCGVANCYRDTTTLQYQTMEEGCVDGETAFGYILEGKRIAGSMCNKLLDRRLLQNLRFPLGHIYEDAMFIADLMPLVQTVAYTTQPKYYYYHRAGSSTTSRFKSRDMDAILAYDKTRQVVRERYPSLSKVADFRYIWAHFVVLDRMLAVDDYSSFPEFKPVVRFLKKNAFAAAANANFTKGRRLAALILRFSLPLYRKLMLHYQHQVADDQ